MKIVELQRSLDDNTSWRKKELLQAQFLTENAHTDEAQRYLCRAWVLMMYAHCDNFLKEATRSFLEYIKVNAHDEYNTKVIWLIMRAKDNVTEGSVENYWSLVEYMACNNDILIEDKLLRDILEKRSFQYKYLRFICDWVLQINYDHASMLDFCNRLKKKRDCIAHGEDAYIDKIEDCIPWNRQTLEFMDGIKGALLDSLTEAKV